MIRKTLLAFSLPFLLAFVAFGQQQGTITERLTLESKVLQHSVSYSVYLPPDYHTSNRWYPVVYLLHGFTGCEIDWVQYGRIDHLANAAIADGTIPPMIIVMPDADSTWYINDVGGKSRYEEMMAGEFIPAVERKFRIRGTKEFRGIAGLSMGGYGTLVLAMRHPELFTAAAGLSAAIVNDAEFSNRLKNDRWGYNTLFGPLRGDTLPEHWHRYSVLKMAETTDAAKLSSVRWWLDCGDDDYLFEGNALLSLALHHRKIAHEYRVRDGAHTWEYWRTGIVPALEFIGRGFTR